MVSGLVSLNPLRIGELSLTQLDRLRGAYTDPVDVSIPFASGNSLSRRTGQARASLSAYSVSIPFASGNSLPQRGHRALRDRVRRKSQSPSHRGTLSHKGSFI